MPIELLVTIALCFVGLIALTVYLIVTLMKHHTLRQLYATGIRDFRFVAALLRLFGKKKKVIKNPCLLRSYGDLPPRADLVIVGGGGVLIVTAVEGAGQYTTPPNEDWTVWQDGEMKQIPCAFRAGKRYASVISKILMKNGLSCPIHNIVVLTDDHAKIDTLHSENVMTANDLIPFVQAFDRRHALSSSQQQLLRSAVKQHHELCQRQLASAIAVSDEQSEVGAAQPSEAPAELSVPTDGTPLSNDGEPAGE